MPGIDHRLDPDQRLHVRVEAVIHQLEFTVRRDERNGAVVLEAGQPDALVEPDVLHFHRLAFGDRPTRCLEEKLVVQPKFELGHAREVRLHFQGSDDLGPQHRPIGRHQEIQLFDDIQKYLVLLVFDSLRSPRDGVRDGGGGPQVHRELVRLGLDVLAQYFHLGGLRISVVHHLVQELVRNNKIVLDALFLELLKVVPQNLREAIEERHHERGIRIPLSDRHEIEVVVLHPNKTDPILTEHGLHNGILCINDVLLKALRDVHRHLPAVVPADDHLALQVHDEHGRCSRHGAGKARFCTAEEASTVLLPRMWARRGKGGTRAEPPTLART
mmetsp:Transcript_8152/g.20441  ORF Transcript_8152/g.20441 Transcript_8152/m.20441 type:complete len:329 (+) Transcript_8152:596-1582(+)